MMVGIIGLVYRIKETSRFSSQFIVLTPPNANGKVIVAPIVPPRKAIQANLVLNGKHDASLFASDKDVLLSDFSHRDANLITQHVIEHEEMVDGICPPDILALIVGEAKEKQLTEEVILAELLDYYGL